MRFMAYENVVREMKVTKKGTLKKDITATLVIRPRVLLSKAKSKRRPGTAWTGVLMEKFSQPKVSEKLWATLPSLRSLLFPSFFSFIQNYNADPSSNPAVRYEERWRLLFPRGSGAQPQRHKKFWLIWRPGTTSGSKGFFLYSNSTV